MTDTTEDLGQAEGILKVDRLGRVQTPPERRAVLLEEFGRSGMSAKAFARRYGIKYQTFCWWRHQGRKAPKKGGGPKATRGGRKAAAGCFTLALAEVAGAAHRAAAPLVIELVGGHRLAVNDPNGVALAAQLIRELAKAPC